MTDPWSVRRAGKRMLVVDHPLGGPRFYKIQDPDSFWSKAEDEQRQTAILRYWEGTDPVETDVDVGRVLHQDAKEAGVFDDRDGEDQ